ncbi:MAG TPA: hypothetical protein VJP77_04025, partial [Planctomycetota bacterium]|nr:hypothetical protein [Planctomycetota bacterium]
MLRPLPSRRPVHALLPLFALVPLAQLPPPGATVARIGVEAPVATQFVLRATVPVPKGVLVEQTPAQAFLDPGAVPLRVVDWNGAPATAQVSVVSRYPKDADGPDVVEVLARVRRNPSAPVGSLLQYDVVWAGAQSGSLFPHFDIHPKVAELVLKPGALLVRSQDVHGNWYFLDLLGTFGAKLGQYGPAEFLRLGPVLAQTRRYGVQDRVQGSAPVGTPLPHALGVHAYLTARTGESTIALDLRFSNASSNLDPTTDADDPVGRLYLRQIELLVPDGWVATEAVTDSAAGAPYSTGLGWTAIPLVEPLPGGKLHLFPAHC